jgi:phospholipase C
MSTTEQDLRKHVDPIKHVVLLMLENHSFDQMLGGLQTAGMEIDGVNANSRRVNYDDNGKAFYQEETRERQMILDPQHDVDHVAIQLQDNNGGFVKDFARATPNATDTAKQFIMGYYPAGFLPALHALAGEYRVCDQWFSSVPGPTWPNRFFALTGTSSGRVNMPEDGKHTVDAAGFFEQDQDTIFDRLSARGIDWKIYFQGIPQSVVLKHQRRLANLARYFYMTQFYEDARGAAEDFPEFCLIEPDFMGAEENDDHPPHDIMKAQKLIADVYNALRANRDLWASTLLVVYYDEHGGFFDHVVPPKADPPDGHHEEYTFDQLGLRVPAVLVSPWVVQGVAHERFDHTSVLRYLIEKWGLAPLGDRVKAATSIDVALNLNGPARSGVLPRIELSPDELRPPDADAEERAEEVVVGHHRSLALIANYIRAEFVEEAFVPVAGLARVWMAIKMWCERRLAGNTAPRPVAHVTSLRPDRLSRDRGTLREDFATYLRQQKEKAITELAQTIRSPEAPAVTKDYAVRTLAHLTGRKFHREPQHHQKADQWLKARGR